MKRSLGTLRTALRYPLSGHAKLYLSGRDITLDGVLIDISKTGVSLMIPAGSPKLMKKEVGMLTVESADLPDFVTCFVSIARLVPSSEGCMLGLDFMSIDEENHTKVSAFLALAKARAARLAK